MSKLLDIFNESCPDEDIKTLITIDLPYKEDILNGEFEKDLQKKNTDTLAKAFKTYGYLGIESENLVKEFVWKIGKNELFFEYFKQVNKKKFSVRSDIDKVIYHELIRTYPDAYSPEELGCRFYISQMTDYSIAGSGNLRLLEYYLTTYDDMVGFYRTNQISNRKSSYPCAKAAMGGHFHVLKWLRENNYPLDDTRIFSHASLHGRFDIMKWLRSEKCKWDSDTYTLIGDGPELFEMIKWLVQEGCPWGRHSCSGIIKYGRLDILEWLVNYNVIIYGEAYISAIKYDKLDVVKWLINNNVRTSRIDVFPFHIDGIYEAISDEYILCSFAAKYDKFEILKWLLDNNHQFNHITVALAIQTNDTKTNNFEILKMLHSKKKFNNTLITAKAAELGNIEVLKWLLSNDYPIDASANAFAARRGDFEMLKYLRSIDCPYDNSIMINMVSNYHGINRITSNYYEIMDWLISQGCQISKEVFDLAVYLDDNELMDWLHKSKSC